MLEAKDKFEEKADNRNMFATFENGCKPEEKFTVGMEFERLSISSTDFKMVNYAGENGIYDLLRTFARLDGWDYIIDDYHIIGLKR